MFIREQQHTEISKSEAGRNFDLFAANFCCRARGLSTKRTRIKETRAFSPGWAVCAGCR